MKKLIVVVLAIAIIGLLVFVFSIKNENNKATDKLTNFSSDFFGISFLYPEYLKSSQIETNYARQLEERVSFKKNGKINQLFDSSVVFQVRLEYEKFNENEVFEYLFPEEKLKFKQMSPISLIKATNAENSPEAFKIKDVNKITIGDNVFYTYAYSMDGKRVDNFIIPQRYNSIIFTFYNQDENFIKNILSSVKRIDGIYSPEGKQIIKNENIGLDQIDIPRNWLVTNSSTSTAVKYDSKDRDVEILITNFDTSQNSIPENMEKLKNSNLTRMEEIKIEDSLGCGINSWLYLNKGLSGCVIENDNGFKAYYKVNNKKLYIYYNAKFDNTAFNKKNRMERNYLTEILDSIITSDTDILNN